MKTTPVVIPAAGLGSRFLPYTKTIPKELLALDNKPAIHHIVHEAVTAGMRDFYIIANDDKQMILDYFSRNTTLEHKLANKKTFSHLQELNDLIQSISIQRIDQPQPLGLGHAVLMARNVVGSSYFSVMLPDDIVIGQTPEIGRLAALSHQYNASVIAVQEVPLERVSSYGVIAYDKQLSDGLFQVSDYVEKPAPKHAPSTLCSIGRFVLSPAVFSSLEQITPGAGGEIQLTDAITHMMRTNGERVLALKVAGDRYDTGTPCGWAQAVQALADN